MDKKLKQITDSIHDTIYLSDLESQLISTSYFYRLHEVYQSSTVYMTFPSNRTKRYEHSLGVMDLASEIFYSSVANASSVDRNGLFGYLTEKVIKVINDFFEENGANVNYIKENAASLSKVFEWKEENYEEENVKKFISNIIKKGYIEDKALRQYMVCFFDSSLTDTEDKEMISDTLVYSFVYQCTLQAIRICALFHDVGHPPYSHVIEEVLMNLYSEGDSLLLEAQNENNEDAKKKIELMVKCLKSYEDSEADFYKKGLNMLISFENGFNSRKMHFHESVGVGMLLNVMESELKNAVEPLTKEVDEKNLSRLLYNIVITEFTFAILLEKSDCFKSIHKIIDGPFDADRLDYVVRDTLNCGVDWGHAPYKRIIESAVFRKIEINHEDKYVVTYPEKVVDDIEDILITRYKIFIRINYHHRVAKTATVLKNAVAILAKDFLLSKKRQELSPQIEYLWKSVQATNYGKELKIAKWSDSWLMNMLYDTLVAIKNDEKIKKAVTDFHKDKNQLEVLKELLEELLLNKRHYYTLIKRTSDAIDIVRKMLDKVGLTDSILGELREDEAERFMASNELEEREKARDSLRRITYIEDAKTTGVFELLDLAFSHNINETVEQILKSDTEIKDYCIVDNIGRDAFGIKEDSDLWEEQIYLYDDNKVVEYNRRSQILKQIKALRNTAMEKYCYVSVKEGIDINNKLEGLIDNVVNQYAIIIKKQFCEEYPAFAKDHGITP